MDYFHTKKHASHPILGKVAMKVQLENKASK